jgi:hypothetical protein
MFDARHLLEPQTEVLLTWKATKDDKIFKALTFVADDYLQTLSGGKLALISKTKGVSFFAKMTVPLSKLETAREYKVDLKVIPNDNTYLRMVSATDLVWDPESGRQDLWPLLLNHNPKDLKPINVFTKAGVPENESEAALSKITCLSAAPLNKSQLAVIIGTKSLTGAVQLVQAPGGTGKTSTLSLLTHAYQQTRICTLLCAPTNTAVDEICLRYAHFFGEKCAPLRVYASDYDQENTVLGINRREGLEFDEQQISTDIIMLEVVQSMVESQRNQKRRLMTSDLLSKCLELAKSGTVTIMRQYVDGVDEKNQPLYVGSKLDMCSELAFFHRKANDPTQKSYLE